MKLARYQLDGAVGCGVVTDRGLVDIRSLWNGPDVPADIKELLQYGGAALRQLAERAENATVTARLEDVRLLAPIPRPGKLIALAGNYAEHIKEAGLKLGLSDSPRQTTVPRPFLMPATAVIGPEQPIPWPSYSETIDYELELALVIGRPAKCVSAIQAHEVIAGYTIVNDVSARTVTFAKGRAARPWDEFYDWLAGKWADGFCPMGPYLVTTDEVEDVQSLHMVLTVNGQVRQKANTSQMIYPVADIVSFLSHLMTLEIGDVIATGTPAGVGLASGRYLQSGDVIAGSIEKLGTLRNYMGDRPACFYEPLA